MKKYNLLLIFIAFLTIINCSKSSNTEEEAKKKPEETPKEVNKIPNLQATGDSANDILSNDNFTKLLIQVAYVEGFKPTESAITEFTAFLKKHTFKEDIEVVFKELESSGEEKLELQQVDDLEQENRTVYNCEETLAIYIYFADAPAADDKPEEDLVTLGAVFRNTSMIIYESTLRDLVKSRPSFIGTLEAATLMHEFGHLFGLVNLGTTPVNPDHEDTEAHNHCNVAGCLMRAELEFGNSMKKLLIAKNGIIPDLDAECIADLKNNGGR